MDDTAKPAIWKLTVAFGIVYFVWGSTFLAIRIGVAEVPPLLLAGVRFFLAGSALYVWMRARGVPSPTRQEWLSAVKLSAAMFAFSYGMLFWAEQRVPSGVAAVMMATIPVFIAICEIVLLRTIRPTAWLAAALLAGLAGVAVLIGPAEDFDEAPIDAIGAMALIAGAISWSVATAFLRRFPLPASKPMSAGAQMLAGGVWLMLASFALGEHRRFHPEAVSVEAWLALLYLIVAGSIVAYTAFTWLIHHVSPTKVGTYAYVNPIVAVALGYFLGGETLGSRTLLGSLLVLCAVVVIGITPKPKAA